MTTDNPHDLFDRIDAFIPILEAEAESAGRPINRGVDIALFAHGEPLRPFALSAGRNQANIIRPSPYEAGWIVKWRGIHVIERYDLKKDRITLHYGFVPAVHFYVGGGTVGDIEPITTEHAKRCRAIATKALAKLVTT